LPRAAGATGGNARTFPFSVKWTLRAFHSVFFLFRERIIVHRSDFVVVKSPELEM
jgi:hypothetical protein